LLENKIFLIIRNTDFVAKIDLVDLFLYSFVMTRVRRGYVARQRRKKILSLAHGSFRTNFRLFRNSIQHVIKALTYAYVGRNQRKRQYRSIWLVRLNARSRIYGINYNSFFYSCRQKQYLLNRKVLAQLAIYDPATFQTLSNSLSLCLLCPFKFVFRTTL